MPSIASKSARLRVLLVPDSTYWILGTVAKGIARFNPWIESTIISGEVLEEIVRDDPAFFSRFDLVHFVCPYASKTWLARLHDKIPVVTSHHHVTLWDAVSHNVAGDAIVTGSPEWIDDLVSRGVERDRILCVPYGVDSELFKPADEATKQKIRSRAGLPSSGPLIGFFAKRASNDDDRKGIDVFSSAVKSLHSRERNAAVLIVGPGWQELVDDFRSLKISCAWFPFLEKLEDVAPLYHALDFYWVTARVEGGPVPLLEAMSSGICCLTTPVGLARELVEDGVNAMLLPMNDPDAFVAETIRLWNKPDVRQAIANKGRETIVARMHTGDTLRLVKSAYETAFRNFRHRTGRPVSLSDFDSSSVVSVTGEDLPLSALRSQEKKRVHKLEALAWSEHLLLFEGQSAAAFRLILKAWRLHPMSLEPLRVFLRRFLPTRVVRGIVALKHSLGSG